jgi:hypothetical protein
MLVDKCYVTNSLSKYQKFMKKKKKFIYAKNLNALHESL